MSFKKFLEEAYYDRYSPSVQKVPGWGVPEGMSRGRRGVGTVDNPNDPDSRDGASLSDLTPAEMRAFKDEIAKYGGEMMLNSGTSRALGSLERKGSWRTWGLKKSGVRWALRPPVTNKLAGGIANSYHKEGVAIDVKHSMGTSTSFEKMAQLIVDAYDAGFRGIGFGGSQVHLDTRRGDDMMVYAYSSWIHPWPSDLFAVWLGVDITIVKPDQTGPYGSRPNVTSKMIRELANNPNLGGSEPPTAMPPVPGARPTPYVEKPDTGTDTPDPRPADVADDVRKMDWKNIGVTQITAGVIAAILVGGFFGARRFLRKRDSKKEIDRLLTAPGARSKMRALRNKHKELFNAAKTDPKKREQIERMIARELNNVRDSKLY